MFGRQDEESQLFQNSASLALTCLKFRAERLRTLVNGGVVSDMAPAHTKVTPLHVKIRPGRAPTPTRNLSVSHCPCRPFVTWAPAMGSWRMLSGGRGAIDYPAPLRIFHPSPI